MTLTALAESGSLIAPALMLDRGNDLFTIRKLVKEIQGSGNLYCPDCLQSLGLKEVVKFRGTDPEKTRPHFFHLGDNKTRRCSDWSNESQRHLLTKAFIQDHYQRTQCTVELEHRLSDEDGSRRPDVWVLYANGMSEAHEVQMSRIGLDEISTRTADLWRLGCGRVAWYLYGPNYSKEVLRWAYGRMVTINRLEFDLSGNPVWTPGDPIAEERIPVAAPLVASECLSQAPKTANVKGYSRPKKKDQGIVTGESTQICNMDPTDWERLCRKRLADGDHDQLWIQWNRHRSISRHLGSRRDPVLEGIPDHWSHPVMQKYLSANGWDVGTIPQEKVEALAARIQQRLDEWEGSG